MNLSTVNIQKEIKKNWKKYFDQIFTPIPFVELELTLERNSVSLFFLYT